MSNHRWFRLLPEWLVSCRADWLRPDIVAGLTTGAVIIPMAMAYAMMAGLPVQVGLYTALVPMVIYAVLGTSRVLSVRDGFPSRSSPWRTRCPSNGGPQLWQRRERPEPLHLRSTQLCASRAHFDKEQERSACGHV